MKKLKEKALKFWQWLDGKKTKIGFGLHLTWGIVHMTVPATKPFAEIGHYGIFVITGVGLGDKFRKFLKK